MPKSLLDGFGSLDPSKKEVLADISSPRLLSFAALLLAQEECGVSELSAEHITACLEAAGVAVRKLSVARALAGAHGFVSTRRDVYGDSFFKLMIKGRRELDAVMGANRMSVIRIEQGQPRTARLLLAEILGHISGMVCICDPYYGIKSFDSLDHIPMTSQIRFLTHKTNEAGRKLQGTLRDFKTERPSAEFRMAPNNAGLHDRYLLTKDFILILGHGLKDIGGKESFIVRLDRALVPNLIKSVTASFESTWTRSTPI
jgi:hypothetical protein